MKSHRRQELRTNELAQTIEQAKQFFEKNGNYVVGGLVVIAVIALGYVYVQRSAQQQLADARRQMTTLPLDTDEDVRESISTLKVLVSENDDPQFERQALRRQAYMAMSRAGAAEDGTPSREFLEMAQEAFQSLLERHGEKPLDAGAALMGLATVEEDLFVLDRDPAHKEKAREYLERIANDASFNGTPYQTIALERLNTLDETFIQVALVDAPAGPPPSAESPQTEAGTSMPIGISSPGATSPTLTPIPASEVPEVVREAQRKEDQKEQQQAADDSGESEADEDAMPVPDDAGTDASSPE